MGVCSQQHGFSHHMTFFPWIHSFLIGLLIRKIREKGYFDLCERHDAARRDTATTEMLRLVG